MIQDIKRLFINSMREHPMPIQHTLKKQNDVIDIDYNLNSLGYRDKEFDGKAEVLFLGCSMTHGDGLPEEYIWKSLLAKKLNISSANLGSSGDSIIGQVAKAFYYFEKFGNPKMVVALFPSFRIPTPYVKGKMEASNKFRKGYFEHNQDMPAIEYTEIMGKFDKYSKSPYDPGAVLTEEFVFFYEKLFIDMLRQYCKSNEIHFIWSNWEHRYQRQFYHKINSFYPDHHKGYCYIDAFDWTIPETGEDDRFGEYNSLDCHVENRQDPLFYRAADRMEGMLSHWGTHKHMHVAEAFYKYISDIITK
jgi:hypothetical protein